MKAKTQTYLWPENWFVFLFPTFWYERPGFEGFLSSSFKCACVGAASEHKCADH